MDTGNNRTENRPSTKSGDYLWDRSGEPDPEIQRLEGLLGKFRHDSPPPVFPEIIPNRRWKFFPWRIRLFPVLTTAGVAVAAIVAVTFLVYRTKPTPSTLRGLGCVQRGRDTSNRGGDDQQERGNEPSRRLAKCLRPTVSHGPAFGLTIPARSRWSRAHAFAC